MADDCISPSSPCRRPRRGTLEGLFPDLTIEPISRPRQRVGRVLSGSFRRNGWPNWNKSISRATGAAKPLDFTIKMDSTYRAIADAEDPKKLFEKASSYILDIRQLMRTLSADGAEIIEKNLTNQMTSVVFGSNHIERVGLGLDETIKLCEAIFRGEDVNPEDVGGRSPTYQNGLEAFVRKNAPADQQYIIRSHREVIQHACALQHIITAIVVDEQPLSEKLILETHKILCSDIDIENGAPARFYAGKYRTVPVRAGNCGFVPPNRVPGKMKEFVESFNRDIIEAEAAETLDPFVLAAKYCQEFVMIHPFLDGNGRTCRLILNAILLRYAGILVPIGGHDRDRAEYLGIARRASDQMEGCGELATLVLRGATPKLRALKQKLRGRTKGKGDAKHMVRDENEKDGRSDSGTDKKRTK